ncbi:Chromobox protein 1, partial [Spiromyces aspiralis]
ATNPFKTTTSVDMQIDENAPSINIHGGAEAPSAKPRNTVPEATPAGGSANGDTNGEAKDGDDDLNGHGEARDAMRADGGDEEKEEEGSGVEDLGEGHDGEEKLGDDEGEDEYTVEKILDDGEDDDGNKLYLIKWLGYPDSENTWEPMENIPEDLITEYESKKKKTKPKKS